MCKLRTYFPRSTDNCGLADGHVVTLYTRQPHPKQYALDAGNFLNALQSYSVVKHIQWIDLNNFNVLEVCTVQVSDQNC